ncbi:MAG: gluconolactonase [Gammaproteobacteria bacterium]|nr:gluconolactonase [Gammaproteobacteria bacterium]
MEKLFDGGTFFEGPRWHGGAWWVSDFYSLLVRKITLEGKVAETVMVENQPSGIGFLPDGSLLVVSMKDRRILRHCDGRLTTHADLSAVTGGPANDMLVDGKGRAYVGNFGFDIFGGAKPASTTLVRVDPDGSISIVADDLRCPNGTVITADGKTLIVAESFAARLTAFTIDEDGSLTDRRVWAALGKTPPWDSLETIQQTTYAPDGCAIDAEDHVWVADAFNGRVCRVAPGGKIVDEVLAPNGWGVYACALGGVNGRQLLLCVAPDFDDVKRRATPEAALYLHEVTVPRGEGLP